MSREKVTVSPGVYCVAWGVRVPTEEVASFSPAGDSAMVRGARTLTAEVTEFAGLLMLHDVRTSLTISLAL